VIQKDHWIFFYDYIFDRVKNNRIQVNPFIECVAVIARKRMQSTC